VVDAKFSSLGNDHASGPPTSSHGPVGLGLHQRVSYSCGLDRAGDDGQPACIGGELAEQSVVNPAADDMDHIDALS
jgi:hypothetical protein